MSIEIGKNYTEAGVVTIDAVDREVTYSILSNNINTHVIGIYQVVYKAEDSSGNIIKATKIVNIKKRIR